MALTERQQQFVTEMMPYALEAAALTGVAPEVILAQAAHESAWGTKAPGNNYFGIKGAGQTFATTEYVNGHKVSTRDSFRSYSSPRESFMDWARLMTTKERYSPVVSATDRKSQIAALAKSGYATDPRYGAKVGSIADRVAGLVSAVERPFDPSSLGNMMAGLGYAPDAWRGQPNVQAVNAMASGGAMPEMADSVPGVPVSGQPTQDQLQSRFYDELFQPMQANGPERTVPPRVEMFNDAFGVSAPAPAYPSREPRTFGPMSPAPIALPVPSAVNEYRQKAEENLRQAMSRQSQGFGMADLMTLPSQMNQSGRPAYADQNLPPPIYPNPPSMTADNSPIGSQGRSVRTSSVGPDPTYNDDAVIAAMDGGGSSYTPNFADAFGMSVQAAPQQSASLSRDAIRQPSYSQPAPMSQTAFNARFEARPDPAAGYTALTGRSLPTAASYMAGLGGFPTAPVVKPSAPVIPAAVRLPSRQAAIGTATARRAPPSPAYRAPVRSNQKSAWEQLGEGLKKAVPQMSFGNISIPNVASQVLGQTYGGDHFSAYTPTSRGEASFGPQSSSGSSSPPASGGSGYDYTTGSVGDSFATSWTNNSGTNITTWTDSNGNNWTTYS